MANSWKTLADGDIVRKALPSFTNALKFVKTISHQYDTRFGVTGAKNGGTLLLREPNEFTVRSGATMDVQNITETTQTLTLATQRGVDIDVSTIDHTLSVDDFEDRVLNPAMERLAAEVENIVLANVYKDVFNFSGTAATTPASQLAVLNAGVKLSQGLAPDDNRYILFDSVAMATTVNAFALYFHKASEIERQFNTGKIGEAAGFSFMESNMLPSHTNGTRTDVTPVCNTSTGITSGSASIVLTAGLSEGTYLKGDVFTIADVYAVNRQTKTRYSHLQQFVVTANATAIAGGVTLTVSPVPVTSGAKQNVELVSAGASKAVTVAGSGSSGAASTVYTQPLAYHRDAFTFVSADLYTEPSQKMTKAVKDGISLRLWRAGDIINDTFPLRFDVVFGFKTIRPEWACRVRG